jgi:hypothetical protein
MATFSEKLVRDILDKSVQMPTYIHTIRVLENRVARWFVFKPKIPIWEKFSGPQIGTG